MKNYYYTACGCDVYKVMNNGTTWQLYKQFKSAGAAQRWVDRH